MSGGPFVGVSTSINGYLSGVAYEEHRCQCCGELTESLICEDCLDHAEDGREHPSTRVDDDKMEP